MPKIRLGVVRHLSQSGYNVPKKRLAKKAQPTKVQKVSARRSYTAQLHAKSGMGPPSPTPNTTHGKPSVPSNSDDWWKRTAAASAKKHAPLSTPKRHKSSLMHPISRRDEGY